MLAVFTEYLNINDTDYLYHTEIRVPSDNLVHGDALRMLNANGRPIMVAEWGYLGKGKFSAAISGWTCSPASSFREEGLLFKHWGSAEIFRQVGSYPR